MTEITVQSYSGYRAEERPRSFQIAGRKIRVEDILRRWIEEGMSQGEGWRNCFQIRGDDGKIYCLCYDLIEEKWFIR
jgi:hypothetical protein